MSDLPQFAEHQWLPIYSLFLGALVAAASFAFGSGLNSSSAVLFLLLSIAAANVSSASDDDAAAGKTSLAANAFVFSAASWLLLSKKSSNLRCPLPLLLVPNLARFVGRWPGDDANVSVEVSPRVGRLEDRRGLFI